MTDASRAIVVVWVVINCDHLSKLEFSPVNPLVITEHGALMAASILNSTRAIEVGFYIVRDFVSLRRAVSEHEELSYKISQLENKLADHDDQIIRIEDNPTPAAPLVASRMALRFVNAPFLSAASIIAGAGRSLMDPPGLNNSIRTFRAF